MNISVSSPWSAKLTIGASTSLLSARCWPWGDYGWALPPHRLNPIRCSRIRQDVQLRGRIGRSVQPDQSLAGAGGRPILATEAGSQRQGVGHRHTSTGRPCTGSWRKSPSPPGAPRATVRPARMAGIFRVDVDVNAEPDNKLVNALVRGVLVRLCFRAAKNSPQQADDRDRLAQAPPVSPGGHAAPTGPASAVLTPPGNAALQSILSFLYPFHGPGGPFP